LVVGIVATLDTFSDYLCHFGDYVSNGCQS